AHDVLTRPTGPDTTGDPPPEATLGHPACAQPGNHPKTTSKSARRSTYRLLADSGQRGRSSGRGSAGYRLLAGRPVSVARMVSVVPTGSPTARPRQVEIEESARSRVMTDGQHSP